MAKLSAWIITIVGVIMVLGLIPGIGFDWTNMMVQWVLALLVLVLGVTKLARNYKKKR